MTDERPPDPRLRALIEKWRRSCEALSVCNNEYGDGARTELCGLKAGHGGWHAGPWHSWPVAPVRPVQYVK
jgi:hypothetical protein